MKKIILIASLFISQVSFATSPKVANACLGQVQALQNNLLNIFKTPADTDKFGTIRKEKELTGKTAQGDSCRVNAFSMVTPQSDTEPEITRVDFSIYNDTSGIHYGFGIETYRNQELTGLPGGPYDVDFNLHSCKVQAANFTAKVSYSSVGSKRSIVITNHGNGVLEFKIKDDATGVLGLLYIAQKGDCTVDLKNQE